MARHEVKVLSDFFEAVLSGRKKAENRWNDKGYQVGDDIVLQECVTDGLDTDGRKKWVFTGRKLIATITYVLNGWGLKDGYVQLSLDKVEEI